MLPVCIKYYMRDLVCDVANCCASSFDVGKISVYDTIVIKNS